MSLSGLWSLSDKIYFEKSKGLPKERTQEKSRKKQAQKRKKITPPGHNMARLTENGHKVEKVKQRKTQIPKAQQSQIIEIRSSLVQTSNTGSSDC